MDTGNIMENQMSDLIDGGIARMEENKKPENPNAFACASDNGYQAGMTLRDYFAAKTLPEIIRQWSRWEKSIDYKEMNQGDAENIAEQSYYIADAMLKQREL